MSLIPKGLMGRGKWPYPRLGHSGSTTLDQTESVTYESQLVETRGFHQLHRPSVQTAGNRSENRTLWLVWNGHGQSTSISRRRDANLATSPEIQTRSLCSARTRRR